MESCCDIQCRIICCFGKTPCVFVSSQNNQDKFCNLLVIISLTFIVYASLSYTLLDAVRDEVLQGAKLSIEEESIYACIHELLLKFVGRGKNKDQFLQLEMNLRNSY